MAFLAPSANCPLIPIRLDYYPQITVDVADAAVKVPVPFDFYVVGAAASVRAIAGTTPPTDVDVDLYLNTTKLKTMPVVDASAIGRPSYGNAELDVSGASLKGSAGDFVHLKLIDVTGGSSPTCDGLQATIWITPR